ncbi:MAG: rod shape-determining protein MreD [Bacillota bacterium]|jgi:rod shape-determining protein MreD|nr:rod shape-determining protein MreD [Bacillota bacterium]HHT89527.1 rod shape-determining protein MreD [Bacillota bacterium]
MRTIGYALIMVLGLAFQTAGSPGFVLFGTKPELMLLLTLLFAMLLEPGGAACFGFFSGLLQDVLIGRFIGLYAMTYLLMAVLAAFVAKRFYKENFLVRFLIVLGGTLLGQIVYLLGAASFGSAGSWSWVTWRSILGTSALNGLLGVLLYRPLLALHKRLVYIDELLKRTG